jgi:uncharacterized protein (DUF1800 family)
MLTRRQFHQRLIAGLAAASLPLPSHGAANPDTAVELYLNRLSFGVRPQDRATVHDPLQWLEDQLAMPASDPALDALLAEARLRITYEAERDENGNNWSAKDELRPLAALGADPAEYLYCIDWDKGIAYAERARPAHETIAASMIRAVHAPAQLREVMTQFWHDHFNVNSTKDEYCAAFFPSYDAMLRENAFGNFRVLLGEVARAPAMLYYLNNADSKASPANENFARELLELHTLGAGNYLNDRYDDWQSVPKGADGMAEGYMDLDVYEVARAFTGWSVGDGRYISEGVTAPKTGRFTYIEAWHDPYQKRILGVEFLPNRAPMADGDDVLDMLARHPGTARFVCTKLARRFLSDTPPDAVIDHLATVFRSAVDAPDQMTQVIRALVNHPAFAAIPPGKIRRPFEFLVGLYRATGAQITGTESGQQWVLMKAGWRQHEYGPPTGHPDVLAAWTGASALNRIVDFAMYAHDDWFAVATLDRRPQPGEQLGTYMSRWSNRFGVPDLTDLITEFDGDPATPMTDFTEEEVNGLANAAIGFSALRPAFMLR